MTQYKCFRSSDDGEESVKDISESTRRYAAQAIHFGSGFGAVANLARAYLALSKERDELRERLLLLLKKIDETLER